MPKRIAHPLLISIACITGIISASGQTNTLYVLIKNARNNNGVVRVTLFTKEKDYMKDFSTNRIAAAKIDEVRVVFENIPPGEYAITVYHDENNNGKFDSNFFGIPKEGTGFSNDASAFFGPPSWKKAKFKWDGGTKPSLIHLKYF